MQDIRCAIVAPGSGMKAESACAPYSIPGLYLAIIGAAIATGKAKSMNSGERVSACLSSSELFLWAAGSCSCSFFLASAPRIRNLAVDERRLGRDRAALGNLGIGQDLKNPVHQPSQAGGAALDMRLSSLAKHLPPREVSHGRGNDRRLRLRAGSLRRRDRTTTKRICATAGCASARPDRSRSRSRT